MSKINVGHFEPDGNTIYLPIGYVPDFFLLCELGATNPLFYYWWEMMEDDEAAQSQEGVIDSAGTKTKAADDAGIAAYDLGTDLPLIYVWAASTTTLTQKDSGGATTTKTARTATAHGSYIIPTTSSDMDRDAVFECVTSSGNTGATEPTWPASIGDQIADGNNVWERVNVPTFRGGYQGVSIEDNIQTDGQEMYYLALLADSAIDHGDVLGWVGGIYGA